MSRSRAIIDANSWAGFARCSTRRPQKAPSFSERFTLFCYEFRDCLGLQLYRRRSTADWAQPCLTAGSPALLNSTGQETPERPLAFCTDMFGKDSGLGSGRPHRDCASAGQGCTVVAQAKGQSLQSLRRSQKPAVGALTFLVGRGKLLRTPFLKMTGLYSSGTLRCITGLFL